MIAQVRPSRKLQVVRSRKSVQLSGIENDGEPAKRRILCIDGGGILRHSLRPF